MQNVLLFIRKIHHSCCQKRYVTNQKCLIDVFTRSYKKKYIWKEEFFYSLAKSGFGRFSNGWAKSTLRSLELAFIKTWILYCVDTKSSFFTKRLIQRQLIVHLNGLLAMIACFSTYQSFTAFLMAEFDPPLGITIHSHSDLLFWWVSDAYFQ